VSRQTVISIENGRYLPSLPLAFPITRFSDLTVDKMLTRTTRRRDMMRAVPPRLRAPVFMLVGGAVIAAIAPEKGAPGGRSAAGSIKLAILGICAPGYRL
jgi:hypothetical protein